MAELTEAVAEAAEVVADEALEVAEVSRSLSGREVRLVLICLGSGMIVGGAMGAFFMERRLRTRYEKIAEEEIDSMREHFRSRLVAKETKPDLSDLGKKVERLGYVPQPEIKNPEQVAEETYNIFKDAEIVDDWDMEHEKASRTPRMPYVIHVDERHESGYTESTLTYYAGDDVLCDERDKIIEDQDLVVGVMNLDRFGHGSGDPNIVYIRNDDLAIEVEVVKSDRTFAEDVHGITHSDPPRERRPRWDE
jgi:hypothetical protein